MQKHYSVATYVLINLPKKPFFSINYGNSALKIEIIVVLGAFLNERRLFR